MIRSSRQQQSISVQGVALMLGICVLAMPAVAQATEYGAESPQALHERLQKAGESKDFGEVAACIAPDDRAQMTLMMVFMTGFAISMSQVGSEMGEELSESFADDMSEEEKAEARRQAEEAAKQAAKQAAELEAKFKAILKKHGATKLLDEDAQMEPGPDDDPAAAANKLLEGVDQVALLKDLFALMESVSDESDEESGPMPMAAGELTNLQVDGDRATAVVGDEEVEMVRIDGRWYARMPIDE